MNVASDEDLLRRFDALSAQGQLTTAVQLAEQALAAGSTRMLLHFRLTAAYLKTGRYRDALELTLRAAELRPAAPGDLVELAQRLVYFNQSVMLRQVAGRLLAAPVWHAGAEADFAALLSMVGEQALASALLERAIAVAGSNPGSLYNRSQMHLYSGRMAEAERDLLQCLRLQPAMAKAHWALSKLPRAAATEPELASMRSLAVHLPAGSQDEVFLRFALFNRLDQLKRSDEAWTELARGCQAKRGLLNYDAAATSRFFDALIRATPTSDAGTNVPAAAVGDLTPVFIVGMHRSGTTLVERLLGNHSRVSEGGELYDFPAQLRWAIGRHFNGPSDVAVVEAMADIDFAQVGRRYLQQVHWRAAGKPVLIDKLPSNFINIGFIHRALPQARVIHMRRNAMDTCFSNLKELFSNACAYSYDQIELADYYAQYRRLMAHWQQAAPGLVLDVSYEELARDPRSQAERILAFCGLDWEAACLDVGSNTRTVNTASSAQVREPIHQRSIEAWRRYETQLAPLAGRLAAHGLS
jgi:tetratricopeptide (TPR) repeat protein